MWICSKCNNENNDQDLYCVNCGNKKPSSQSVISGSYGKYSKILMTKTHTFDPYKTPLLFIAIALYALAYVFVLIAGSLLNDGKTIIEAIVFMLAFLGCIVINITSKDAGLYAFYIIIGISEVVNSIINLTVTGDATYFIALIIAFAILALAIVSAFKIHDDVSYGFAKGTYLAISIILIIGGLIGAIDNFYLSTQVPDIIETGRGYNYELAPILRNYYNLLGAQGIFLFISGILSLLYVTIEIKKHKYFFKEKEKNTQISTLNNIKEIKDKPSTNNNDPVEMLKQLKELLDKNLITQEEYEEKRKKYIDML